MIVYHLVIKPLLICGYLFVMGLLLLLAMIALVVLGVAAAIMSWYGTRHGRKR